MKSSRFVFAAALAFFAVSFATDADAARRWFVDDVSGVIVAFADDDGAHTPDGSTPVLDATIRMADPPGPDGPIYQGGTWDGATYSYTPPAGATLRIDPSTARGAAQEACDDMLDVFDIALAFIDANRFAWLPDVIAKAEDGMHWQIVNSARVALNSTRTHARRQKFCEESASWPDGTNGDVLQYVDAMGETGIATLTKDWSWVDPEADPFTRHDAADAAQGFNNATNVEDAPGSAKLIGRGWIRDIP